MSLENKRRVGLALFLLIACGLFSLKPVRRAVIRAAAFKGHASRPSNDHRIFSSNPYKLSFDLAVEEETDSSKLRQPVVGTAKRIDLSDESGSLRSSSVRSTFYGNSSIVDFSPVLNL